MKRLALILSILGTASVSEAGSKSQSAATLDGSCTIKSGGVYCWGNTRSSLGTRWTAALVPGLTSGVTALAASDSAFCAIQNGYIYCWGDTYMGQLGTGSCSPDGQTCTPSAYSSPQLVPVITGATDIVGGGAGHLTGGGRDSHFCAIYQRGGAHNHGLAACWGSNAHGLLGINQNPAVVVWSSTPAKIQDGGGAATLQLWESLAAGSTHNCGLYDGPNSLHYVLYCWGANVSGELGDNTLIDRYAASNHTVLASDGADMGTAYDLSAGNAFTCAAVTNSNWGTYCWGSMDYPGAMTPIGYGKVPLFAGVVGTESLAAGGGGTDHMCAETWYGVVCWGSNENGEIGNNTERTGTMTGNQFTCTYCYTTCFILNTQHWATCPQVTPQIITFGNGAQYDAINNTLVAGYRHTFSANLVNGTQTHYNAWGLNASGQLGSGTSTVHPDVLVPGTQVQTGFGPL